MVAQIVASTFLNQQFQRLTAVGVVQSFQGQAQRLISMPEFSKAILARCAVVAARVEQNKEQLRAVV